MDVKPDTLWFTNFFNANTAASADSKLDTFAVHFKDLDKLNLISDSRLLRCETLLLRLIEKRSCILRQLSRNWGEEMGYGVC